MELALIAAVGHNRVIGKDGGLVFRDTRDMARFVDLTRGHPVIMGRKTYDSIPERFRPLKGRQNIVMSRDNAIDYPGIQVARSIEEALEIAKVGHRVGGIDSSVTYVVGGGSIYEQALPFAAKMELTEVHADLEGDTFFPNFSYDEWAEEERNQFDRFDFVTYKRIR